MKQVFALLAVLALAVPVEAQDAKPMTLEQTMLLRCSAVFQIVASEQARGAPGANAYPPLKDRGKEYFVRAGARLMDELQLSEEQFRARIRAEVESQQKAATEAADPKAYVDSVMQPCLVALDASGL
jgi:hypothetical protein